MHPVNFPVQFVVLRVAAFHFISFILMTALRVLYVSQLNWIILIGVFQIDENGFYRKSMSMSMSTRQNNV